MRTLRSGLDEYVPVSSVFTERRDSLPENVRAATSLGEHRPGNGSKVSGSLQSDGQGNGRWRRPAYDGHAIVKRIPASSHAELTWEATPGAEAGSTFEE